MKCPKCHFDNPENTNYCGKCATKLDSIPQISVTKTIETPSKVLTKGIIFAGKYRILEELGQGGMGIVYKAEDTKLQRTVALKFLPPETARDSRARERFVREAQAAAALDHPNICTIYDVEEAEEKIYIAMAYVEGQSLKQRIESEPFSIEETVDIAIQVAEGLEEAHKKGIVHRDIKSSNIMLDKKGRAKVMDFGLAKVEWGEQMTGEGTTLGTVAYMSPEQAKGEAVDFRTDIWSFGVVLYEMLTRKMPFDRAREASVLYSIVHEAAKPLQKLRPDIPSELEKIIERTMAKQPGSRYPSAAEMLKDLRQCQMNLDTEEAGIKDLKSFLRIFRKPSIALPAIAIIVAFAVFAAGNLRRSAKVRWARNKIIPEIVRLVDERSYLEAFKLSRQIKEVIPDDPMLARLRDQISLTFPLQTDPPGADVYIKDLRKIDQDWVYLGSTSEKNTQVPRYDAAGWYCLWKVEKEGYETVEYIGFPNFLVLNRKGSLPARMVAVQGGSRAVFLRLYNYDSLMSAKIGDFLIDKFEVTNREYKKFVESGGYKNPEYWKQAFEINGKALTREMAMELFRDKTGRPGPATWEYETYPEGQDDYPVTGVSWYEAAAYAEFVGKRLPTVYHWDKIGSIYRSGEILPGSNIGSKGLAPVGSYKTSIGEWGTYDTAGNAREWCFNAVAGENLRFVLGAAWDDPAYFFLEPDPRSPFDRSPGNGFRCMKLVTADPNLEELERPLKRVQLRDWSQEKPLSEDEFNTWMSLITYDKAELNPKLELVDESSGYWRMEKISFDAAYDKERMLAYLFLPKNTNPPFQTVIYWPGASAANLTDSLNGKGLDTNYWDYFTRDGRAVLYPILKGTYERGGSPEIDLFKKINVLLFNKNFIIKHLKDIMRSVDYLESRDDIAQDKIAFCGLSWGAHLGPLACTVEKRFKTGILISGCLWPKEIFGVSHKGWIQRCVTPILMINGEYDSTFRYKETQKPFFEALGTPKKDKKHLVLPDGHTLSRQMKEVIKESLAWLDKYLGPVK
jgi:serine/threonine protein kinase/dienelactone hydrolase